MHIALFTWNVTKGYLEKGRYKNDNIKHEWRRILPFLYCLRITQASFFFDRKSESSHLCQSCWGKMFLSEKWTLSSNWLRVLHCPVKSSLFLSNFLGEGLFLFFTGNIGRLTWDFKGRKQEVGGRKEREKKEKRVYTFGVFETVFLMLLFSFLSLLDFLLFCFKLKI